MTTITLQHAQATLADLIRGLTPGEEVVVTDNDAPVARIVAPPRKPRVPGTLRGTVLSMEGFDDPLEEFEEYM